MREVVSRSYRIHEFAELAGVTVKTLYHYDRLGLLQPKRRQAGYRIYAEQDLDRLEQIVALKFLGVPLKQIKAVLERAAPALPGALHAQRKPIEEKQALITRAIRAVRAAEDALESGQPAGPALLRQIIEIVNMQNDIEAMRKYYGTVGLAEAPPILLGRTISRMARTVPRYQRDARGRPCLRRGATVGRSLADAFCASLQRRPGSPDGLDDRMDRPRQLAAGAEASNRRV